MEINNSDNLFIKTIQLFNHIFTVLYMLWWFTPYLNRNLSYSYIEIIILFWLFTALFLSMIFKNLVMNKIIFSILVWLIYIIVLRIIGFSTASHGNYYNQILFWFPVLISSFYAKYMSPQKIYNIIFISVFILLLNTIDNIKLIFQRPEMLQFITNQGDLGTEAKNTNIGSTMFSLYVLLFIPFLISLISNCKIKIFKVIIPTIIIIFFAYLYIAMKTTALLLSAFSIIIYFILLRTSKKSYYVKGIIISGIMVLIFVSVLIIPSIFAYLAEVIPNNNISSRLQSISDLFNGNLSFGNSLSLRTIAWQSSINTFFMHPIFGDGYHVYLGTNFSGSGSGEHSQILDTFANYGLIGAIMLGVNFYLYFSLFVKRYKKSKYYIGVISCLLTLLIYSLLDNSMDPGSGLIIFLILPLILFSSTKFVDRKRS